MDTQENVDIINLVIEALKKEGMWFTQKTDPTFEEPSSYYSLNEYGEPDEKSTTKIINEVTDLIGDGASDIYTAIELWITDKLSEYKVDYIDNLITQFKDKPVVDGIEAFENPVQLAENKTIKTEDTEYDEYVKQEKELAEDYKNRVINNITDKERDNFTALQKILDEESKDTYVDGFYFPSKAVAIIKNGSLDYHINPYMNLTVANILNLISDNYSIEDAITELFDEYKPDSAYSWADNFLQVLKSLDVTLENGVEEKYVFIDADGNYDFNDEIDTEEAAIQYAKNNNYVRVEKETYFYDYDGSSDEPDTEVIWEANDLGESKNINFNSCTKDKKEETVKRRLNELNTKSDNVINKMITDNNFNSDSKEGQIIIRTQDLFNALSSAGYDVEVAFDNGESTSSIQLGTLGGKVIITITDTEKPLRAFLSGNFEITDDALKSFKDIQDQISVL